MTGKIHLNEFIFYKAEGDLDKLLMSLLKKSRANEWRILVKCDSDEETNVLLDQLWVQTGNQFIGIGKTGDDFEKDQPVLLSPTMTDANQAQALILFGAASYQQADLTRYARVMVVFNQNIGDQLHKSRAHWKHFSVLKLPMKLFTQKGQKWEMTHAINSPRENNKSK